jgi:myo-inositol-1(or 4)-monophosphatase
MTAHRETGNGKRETGNVKRERLDGLMLEVMAVVRRAGAVIEDIRKTAFEVAEKAGDQGPVTRADREADALLKAELRRLVPDAAWLSEETVDDSARLGAERVWIVDPLDGTKEFVAGVPEYAVAVALVELGEPVLGVVYNPPQDEMYWAVKGQGTRSGSGKREAGSVVEGTRLLASRSETKRGEFEPLRASWDVVPVGSIEYKLAWIAAGKGAATVSRGPKWEWDVCAGALLVTEAGGRVSEALGAPLRYNQPRPKVAGILAGAPQAYDRLLADVKRIGASDRMAELD